MQAKGALDGIRVIDFTQHGAGPMCAGVLAQWGAEVIKIEHPVRGDGMRGLQVGTGLVRFPKGTYNFMFEQPNMNKKSIALDLTKEEGKEILHKLVAKSDVFLAALRTREVAKFEIEYEALKKFNDKLIYALITGYGTKGEDRDAAGYDNICYFARSGITYMLTPPGSEPPWPRPGFGDIPSGMYCATGIILALYARDKFGFGQAINLSLFNNGVWSLAADTMHAMTTHQNPEFHPRESTNNPLSNYYQTKDKRWMLMFHMQSGLYWERVCKAIGREELINDPRFNTIEARGQNSVALVKLFDETFAKKTMAEWKTIMASHDLIFSPVQSPAEAVDDPMAKANDFFQTFDHPVWGKLQVLPAPQKFSETPSVFKAPAPQWGQHTEEVLLELGYGWEDIASLKGKKVIA